MSDDRFASDLMALRPLLIRQAVKLCQHRDRAEDLTSDAILRAWSARDRFRPGTNLAAWLLVIQRNLFLTERRQAALHRKATSDIIQPEGVVGGQEAHLILLDTERALRALPVDQARAVMLCALNSYDDAAAAEDGGARSPEHGVIRRIRDKVLDAHTDAENAHIETKRATRMKEQTT